MLKLIYKSFFNSFMCLKHFYLKFLKMRHYMQFVFIKFINKL